jgi:very-short-patch-repair endonuclease
MKDKASPENNYHYNKSLKDRARALRNNSTKTEIFLWNDVLKKGMLKGYAFLRQRPVLYYIADFMCFELMLVIEIDGISHETAEAAVKDARKTADLEAVGFTVLRFSDWEVRERRLDVAESLTAWIEAFEKRRDDGGLE